MTKFVSELLDRPSFSLLGTAASSLTAILADASSFLSGLTACAGAGTACLIFLFWLRKFVVQALHDWKAYKRGKLPPIEQGKPE